MHKPVSLPQLKSKIESEFTEQNPFSKTECSISQRAGLEFYHIQRHGQALKPTPDK